jgi:hypothetical protein
MDLTYSSQSYVCILVSGGAVKCWGTGYFGQVIFTIFIASQHLWRRLFHVHCEMTMLVLFYDTSVYLFFDCGQTCDSSLGS